MNITATSQVPQKYPKQQKLCNRVRVAWRIILCRQAVHGENPEDWVWSLCRLAGRT